MLRITPTGKQHEVMALPAKGHIVVLGTAGSGKTTIALLRAHHLANLPGNAKVLLVTFNGALVEYMKGISNFRTTKLMVENYHKFARGYLNSIGKIFRDWVVLYINLSILKYKSAKFCQCNMRVKQTALILNPK